MMPGVISHVRRAKIKVGGHTDGMEVKVWEKRITVVYSTCYSRRKRRKWLVCAMNEGEKLDQ